MPQFKTQASSLKTSDETRLLLVSSAPPHFCVLPQQRNNQLLQRVSQTVVRKLLNKANIGYVEIFQIWRVLFQNTVILGKKENFDLNFSTIQINIYLQSTQADKNILFHALFEKELIINNNYVLIDM